MALTSISIYNFRSISEITLNLSTRADGSSTFGLIGLNEAGKSSILKAIALFFNSASTVAAKDFQSRSEIVSVSFHYSLDEIERNTLHEFLATQNIENFDASELDSSLVTFLTYYSTPGAPPKHGLITLQNGEPRSIALDRMPSDLIHKPVFWASTDTFLISKPINLTQFAAAPTDVSVPLRNCFLLAGIDDIPQSIANIQEDSTEVEFLATRLGTSVTNHIRTVWPNHPIEITFLINGTSINFHVKDVGSTRAKTADQRSDGFKQFVSFLLTVSAQNENEELSKAILLLDEPETHLHPLAQIYLLAELIKLTSNERDNVVLFATHSNYMIDKADLSRNTRVHKVDDVTQLEELNDHHASYSSVTYEVFEIPSTDYHNELFGRLHQKYQDDDPADEKRDGIKNFDNAIFGTKTGMTKNRPWKNTPNQVTLPTYIRNCIHHPDNGMAYTESELRESIERMRKALSQI